VLKDMEAKNNKAEVSLFIWEVDDDLDGYVSQDEFNIMYKRCISDATGLEPRKLFNLTQFLMYDRNFKGRVTVEETLQILYVRHGRQKLDEEIMHIFGENADSKNAEEEEKFITYNEYVRNVNERALREQKELMRKKQKGELKARDDE
jgi:Ca2+-binding EF-hand superfamily protein